MTLGLELIDRVAALHADAFGWAVVCSGGDLEAGSEALQDAYVQVAMGRATFGGRSSLKTWWLGVVRFTAFRRQRRERRWRRRADDFRNWLAAFGEPAAEAPSPDLPAPVEAEELAAALGRLAPRQSEVVCLVFQHDLTLSEAAGVMGVSVGSARRHYDRAKKRLRALLSDSARPCTLDYAS
jgi:RNA polymerase sigma-70 factor (ECF subfamily)